MRSQLAVLTTGAAAAVLLAGPAATWGLDVSGVTGLVGSSTTQVVSTTQQVVSSTEQTAASTVTNVESTAQTTVQSAVDTTQTAVSSPAPAPTPAPTQAAPSAPSAPQHTATAPRHKSSVGSAVTNVTKKLSIVHAATGAAATTVRRATDTVASVTADPAAAVKTLGSGGTDAVKRTVAATPVLDSSSRLGLSLPICGTGLQAIGPVDLGALITLICDAGKILGPDINTRGPALNPAVGDMLGALGAAVSSPPTQHARHAAATARPQLPHGRGGAPGGGAAARGTGVAGIAGAGATSPGNSVGVAYAPPSLTLATHPVGPTSLDKARDSRHGGLFGSSITGTEILFALLALDWALLMAVLLRYGSRRWRRAPRNWYRRTITSA